MKKIILAVMILLIIPIIATAEELNIKEEIAKNTWASVLTKEIGDLSAVKIQNPLIIVGSNIDSLESSTLNQLTGSLGIANVEVIHDDSITQYKGKSIWEYDLILIGGPDHNKITKQLADEKLLNMTTRDTNEISFIVEKATGPLGNTVLVAGSIYGYKFDKKNLPIEQFIPEEAVATVLVLTNVAAIGAAAALTPKLAMVKASGPLSKLFNFLKSGAEEYTEQVIEEKSSKKIKIVKKPGGLFGFTAKELGLGVFAAIIFGIAYAWADLQSQFISSLWIYIVAAGAVVIVHELAHNIVAYKYKLDAQFRLWSLGIVLVALSAYLFGNVFAVPGRAVLSEGKETGKRQRGLIYLAGPIANILFAIALIPLSGIASLAQIAKIAIPISLMLAIYNLLPFWPMDGKHVIKWRKSIWTLIFVPLFIYYFWTYLL